MGIYGYDLPVFDGIRSNQASMSANLSDGDGTAWLTYLNHRVMGRRLASLTFDLQSFP